jgi:catechol 2,3-dioxygenase-like lactoylglutathione lyase family enzyme
MSIKYARKSSFGKITIQWFLKERSMNFRYDYTRLLVSNFKACFLFYRDVMGFQPTYGSEDDIYADFNIGTLTLALFDRQKMSEAIGTNHLPVQSNAQDKFCIIFSVDDVEAYSQQLVDRGIQLIAPPTDRSDWGIKTAHFRDPDGNLIEIYKALTAS